MEEFGRNKGEMYLKFSLKNKQNNDITQEREKLNQKNTHT